MSEDQDLLMFVKVSLLRDGKPQASFTCDRFSIAPYIESFLEDGEIGDTYSVELIEMTQEAFDNLDEFLGF